MVKDDLDARKLCTSTFHFNVTCYIFCAFDGTILNLNMDNFIHKGYSMFLNFMKLAPLSQRKT